MKKLDPEEHRWCPRARTRAARRNRNSPNKIYGFIHISGYNYSNCFSRTFCLLNYGKKMANGFWIIQVNRNIFRFFFLNLLYYNLRGIICVTIRLEERLTIRPPHCGRQVLLQSSRCEYQVF